MKYDPALYEVGDGKWRCMGGCDRELPIEKFKKTNGGKGRNRQCNRCLYVKYTRPDAMAKTAEIHAYQLEVGCADCGYSKHAAAMEFDHRPGTAKLFNIGEKMGAYSRQVLWEEIAKCDVVCANCHAIRTAERRIEVM